MGRGRFRRGLLAVAGLVTVLSTTTLGAAASEGAVAEMRCPPAPTFRAPAPPRGFVKPLLTGPAAEQKLDLGGDNSSGDIDIPISVTEGKLPAGKLEFAPGPFRFGKKKIGAAGVVVTVARRTKTGLELNLCIDPRKAGGIAPGTYTGTVQVTDQRLRGRDVPVNVTRQTTSMSLLGWLGVPLTAILGLLGIWLTERRAAGKSSLGKSAGRAFWKWVKVNGALGLAGAGAAAYGIWFSQGLKDLSFGDSGTDFVTLLGTMVGAAYGANGLLSRGAAGKA